MILFDSDDDENASERLYAAAKDSDVALDLVWSTTPDGAIMESKTFGEELRRLRRDARLNLGDMAEIMGIGVAHASSIERNACRPPKAEVIEKFLRAIGKEDKIGEMVGLTAWNAVNNKHVIEKCYKNKNIAINEAEEWVFYPDHGGFIYAQQLRLIADELDRRNEIVSNRLRRERLAELARSFAILCKFLKRLKKSKDSDTQRAAQREHAIASDNAWIIQDCQQALKGRKVSWSPRKLSRNKCWVDKIASEYSTPDNPIPRFQKHYYPKQQLAILSHGCPEVEKAIETIKSICRK